MSHEQDRLVLLDEDGDGTQTGEGGEGGKGGGKTFREKIKAIIDRENLQRKHFIAHAIDSVFTWTGMGLVSPFLKMVSDNDEVVMTPIRDVGVFADPRYPHTTCGPDGMHGIFTSDPCKPIPDPLCPSDGLRDIYPVHGAELGVVAGMAVSVPLSLGAQVYKHQYHGAEKSPLYIFNKINFHRRQYFLPPLSMDQFLDTLEKHYSGTDVVNNNTDLQDATELSDTDQKHTWWGKLFEDEKNNPLGYWINEKIQGIWDFFGKAGIYFWFFWFPLAVCGVFLPWVAVGLLALVAIPLCLEYMPKLWRWFKRRAGIADKDTDQIEEDPVNDKLIQQVGKTLFVDNLYEGKCKRAGVEFGSPDTVKVEEVTLGENIPIITGKYHNYLKKSEPDLIFKGFTGFLSGFIGVQFTFWMLGFFLSFAGVTALATPIGVLTVVALSITIGIVMAVKYYYDKKEEQLQQESLTKQKETELDSLERLEIVNQGLVEKLQEAAVQSYAFSLFKTMEELGDYNHEKGVFSYCMDKNTGSLHYKVLKPGSQVEYVDDLIDHKTLQFILLQEEYDAFLRQVEDGPDHNDPLIKSAYNKILALTFQRGHTLTSEDIANMRMPQPEDDRHFRRLSEGKGTLFTRGFTNFKKFLNISHVGLRRAGTGILMVRLLAVGTGTAVSVFLFIAFPPLMIAAGVFGGLLAIASIIAYKRDSDRQRRVRLVEGVEVRTQSLNLEHRLLTKKMTQMEIQKDTRTPTEITEHQDNKNFIDKSKFVSDEKNKGKEIEESVGEPEVIGSNERRSSDDDRIVSLDDSDTENNLGVTQGNSGVAERKEIPDDSIATINQAIVDIVSDSNFWRTQKKGIGEQPKSIALMKEKMGIAESDGENNTVSTETIAIAAQVAEKTWNPKFDFEYGHKRKKLTNDFYGIMNRYRLLNYENNSAHKQAYLEELTAFKQKQQNYLFKKTGSKVAKTA